MVSFAGGLLCGFGVLATSAGGVDGAAGTPLSDVVFFFSDAFFGAVLLGVCTGSGTLPLVAAATGSFRTSDLLSGAGVGCAGDPSATTGLSLGVVFNAIP